MQIKVVEWDASIFDKDETLGETTVYSSTLTPGRVKKVTLSKHQSVYTLALTGGQIVDNSPPRNPSPSTREFTVQLVRDRRLPLKGRLLLLADVPNRSMTATAGNLVKMTIVRQTNTSRSIQVDFLKAGFSTADYGRIVRRNATVTLSNGQSTTADQIKQIFGTSRPRLPVSIVARVGAARVGDHPKIEVVVRVHYTND